MHAHPRTICSLQEALIIHGAFYYLVDNGGNPCIFLQKVVCYVTFSRHIASQTELGSYIVGAFR